MRQFQVNFTLDLKGNGPKLLIISLQVDSKPTQGVTLEESGQSDGPFLNGLLKCHSCANFHLNLICETISVQFQM